MREVLEEYEGKVRLVYRDFPLTSMHANALSAALAAECAYEQGKFWEYHDLLYANQGALDDASLRDYAAQVGLDTDSFEECLSSQKYLEEVQNDYNDGINYGVSGTPTFFVNGQKIGGALPLESFEQVLDQVLAGLEE
jgi:protein-disulfide isomerase